ncbi:MAG: glutathione S-transferase family protein [Hyphomicrobiales bacterium]
MRLYEDPRTPNSLRVQYFLSEKGVDVERVTLDINSHDHKSVEFAEKNPKMRVSVLELDDGTFISESMAICRYFEELHPKPSLFGDSAKEKALIEMWSRRAELGLMSVVASVFRHTHPSMATLEVPQISEWAEANRGKISEELEMYDHALADRQFIAGDAFSVADITLFVAANFMRVTKRRVDDSTPNLLDWFERISAREAFQRGP